MRSRFSETQWNRPRQRDGNVPRTCNECLEKGRVDDVLNWTNIGEVDEGEKLDFEKRPPRPEKFRNMRSLDSLLDREPDIDYFESQDKRNSEVDFLWEARNRRREKNKEKRGEKDRH